MIASSLGGIDSNVLASRAEWNASTCGRNLKSMASWRENGRRTPGKAQLRDLGTMALIGDGVAGLISPRQHCLNWRIGPRPYRKLIDKFVKQPNWTRMLGAAQLGLGLWLILKQSSR